eukprot:1566201-Alexandrium_andersonii.AAC.1
MSTGPCEALRVRFCEVGSAPDLPGRGGERGAAASAGRPSGKRGAQAGDADAARLCAGTASALHSLHPLTPRDPCMISVRQIPTLMRSRRRWASCGRR